MGLQTGPWDPVETKGGGQNQASTSAWGCLQLQQGSEEVPPQREDRCRPCADTEPEPGLTHRGGGRLSPGPGENWQAAVLETDRCDQLCQTPDP